MIEVESAEIRCLLARVPQCRTLYTGSWFYLKYDREVQKNKGAEQIAGFYLKIKEFYRSPN